MSKLTLKTEHLPLVITICGIALLIAVAAIAIQFFYSYQIPLTTSQAGLEDMFGHILMALAEVAVKLGFLGVAAWAGATMLRYGLSTYKTGARPSEHKKEES